jgi:hypothetical protein
MWTHFFTAPFTQAACRPWKQSGVELKSLLPLTFIIKNPPG